MKLNQYMQYALKFYCILWWLEIYLNVFFSDSGQDLEEHINEIKKMDVIL